MCGFAHKYIELGRFKKWISNLFKGDDGELGGARANMNKNLDHLQQATEFAILGNTEETLAMASQLDENQKSHAEMLERVEYSRRHCQDPQAVWRTEEGKGYGEAASE
ncbi:hypothetical protein LB505_009824 [Fusarium chuoi]|nr:hypothetical protein LB505_009824 [Fusarium chuoi]